MSRFVKVEAKRIGVFPALVIGSEHQGPIYLTWDDSPVVGAQCARCQTVVWCDARVDPILNEPRPRDVPEHGTGYRRYYEQKLERFLASLPTCPECQGSVHDRFITNVVYPRFKDGGHFEPSPSMKLMDLDPSKVEVWYLEES